jgi:hypothetical protein
VPPAAPAPSAPAGADEDVVPGVAVEEPADAVDVAVPALPAPLVVDPVSPAVALELLEELSWL